MKACESMLVWNPSWRTERSGVAVVPWPDYSGRGDRYGCSTLACEFSFHRLTPDQRRLKIFVEALHLIVRDGCDPQDVHRALLSIDEYRDCLAADMPGLAEAEARRAK